MNRVKELCMRAGLSQKQVAIHLGVSQPSVSDWFNNKNNPSGERLDRLANLLGVSRSVILGYDPIPGDPVKSGDYPSDHEEQPVIRVLARDGVQLTPEQIKKRNALLRMLMDMDDDELDTAEKLINIVSRKKE